MNKQDYYNQLAQYWFDKRDYETCAYYRIKAKQEIEPATLKRLRKQTQLNSQSTLII